MRATTIVSLIVPVALGLAVTSAPARAKHGGPCRQDVQKLCPDIPPGPKGFRDCLEQHKNELSPACQAHLSDIEAKAAAWHQACGGDVQTLCGDVSGPHQVLKCLHQHQGQLSQACQDLLAQHHRDHHAPAPNAPAPTSGNESGGN
jgi:Cysteine rich repeat